MWLSSKNTCYIYGSSLDITHMVHSPVALFLRKTYEHKVALTIYIHETSSLKGPCVRMDMVETIHDDLLTQWRHIPMGKFRGNIILIQITANYLWASEVFKNQSFKSQLFSSSLKKNTSNWNHGLIYINFQKKSQEMGFKSCCQVYKSIFRLKYYYQNFIIH